MNSSPLKQVPLDILGQAGQAFFLSSERRGKLAFNTPSPLLRERERVRVSYFGKIIFDLNRSLDKLYFSIIIID